MLHFVFVDNGSVPQERQTYSLVCQEFGLRHLTCDEGFNFSRLCNLGAQDEGSEALVFLNDDTELLDPDSLQKLAETALQPGVGAVGARLLYGDRKTVQHAGVALIRNGPSHILRGRRDTSLRYHQWLRKTHQVSAVTAACLAISRKNFEAVGGFDENLPVAYNDVDLCLRLTKMGLQTVVRNDVRLIHHESMSRGSDLVDLTKRQNLAKALRYLTEKHGRLWPDPLYPEGLDQHRPDFRIDWRASIPPLGYRFRGTVEGEAAPQGRREALSWGLDEWVLSDRTLRLEGWALDTVVGSAGVTVELLGFDGRRWRAYPCLRYPRLDAELDTEGWFQGDRAGFYLNATFGRRAWARTQRWALRLAAGTTSVVVPWRG